ncbi:MAG: nucleotidyltransferase [Clostridium sp.]|jgi:predicted nucleotidyltransferase|nr:nucleotidyltransferase [Clostridium sp.]
MKVNGIIAEYNPFHHGHKRHLDESKAKTGADYTIVVMSGNFTQRGEPAVLDKFIRTHMALVGGVDLVLEMPSLFATGSAEFFAGGGVALLHRLHTVDYLVFGSESGDIDLLQKLSALLMEAPPHYHDLLREFLKSGLSYPAAQTAALSAIYPPFVDMLDYFKSPNNLLGVEYINALTRLQSSMNPITTKRVGSDYHDQRLGQGSSSALAIRQALFSRQDIAFLEEQVPEPIYPLWQSAMETQRPMHPNDFSLMLHYKLLQEASQGYAQYMDVSSALSDRIRKNVCHFTDFVRFCELLKTKDLTYTRIARSMLHILLNMRRSQYERARELGTAPYARVLGFRKDAGPLLAKLKQCSEIPLITKVADAQRILRPPVWEMFDQDMAVTSIYASAVAAKSKKPMANEFTISPIIV